MGFGFGGGGRGGETREGARREREERGTYAERFVHGFGVVGCLGWAVLAGAGGMGGAAFAAAGLTVESLPGGPRCEAPCGEHCGLVG